MGKGADAGTNPDWQNPEKYVPMLGLNRRALAWQCLCRDPEFLDTATSIVPSSNYIVKNDPPIIVVTLSEEDHLASWGVHFPSAAGLAYGGGLCRLAS